MSGTATRFEWSNPHAYVFFEVKSDKGTAQQWVAELTGLAMLAGLA